MTELSVHVVCYEGPLGKLRLITNYTEKQLRLHKKKIVKLIQLNYLFPFQSMIHVSTAYANCHLRHIEEKFYDYPVNFEELDEKIDQMDDKTIDSMTFK